MISCLCLFHKPSFLLLFFLLHNTPDIKSLFILVNMSFWFTSSSIHNNCSPALEYSLSIHVLGFLSSQAVFFRKPAFSLCSFFFTFSYNHFHPSIIIMLYKSTSPIYCKIFVDKYFVLIIFKWWILNQIITQSDLSIWYLYQSTLLLGGLSKIHLFLSFRGWEVGDQRANRIGI